MRTLVDKRTGLGHLLSLMSRRKPNSSKSKKDRSYLEVSLDRPWLREATSWKHTIHYSIPLKQWVMGGMGAQFRRLLRDGQKNGLNLSRSNNIVNMCNMRNRRGHTIAGTFVKGEIWSKQWQYTVQDSNEDRDCFIHAREQTLVVSNHTEEVWSPRRGSNPSLALRPCSRELT